MTKLSRERRHVAAWLAMASASFVGLNLYMGYQVLKPIRFPFEGNAQHPVVRQALNQVTDGNLKDAEVTPQRSVVSDELPVSFGACCGIGHRLSRNLPTLVYAQGQNRFAHAVWTDVPWDEIFVDSDMVKAGRQAEEHFANSFPKNWSPAAESPGAVEKTSTTRDLYIPGDMVRMFESKEMWAVVSKLSASLSQRVLRVMDPRRKQYKPLHLCAHFRIGNNEKGDWEAKTWRQVNESIIKTQTLDAMKAWVAERKDSSEVSVFVPSDTADLPKWFAENVPQGWRVINADMDSAKPESGVWFGQFGSNTSAVLNQEEKNGAMAEAVADLFGLGECSALWVPTYSSFSLTGITQTKRRQQPVFFRKLREEGFEEL